VSDWAARQRQADAKVHEAERRVEEALATAEPLLREGNPGNLALVSAAHRVQAQLDSSAVGPDVRRQAEQLLRDVRMLADLDEIRLRQADTSREPDDKRNDVGRFDNSGTAARYAAAFSRYGLDVAAVAPADAVARIRDSAINEAVLAGLDGWMQVKLPDDPQRARLRQVASVGEREIFSLRRSESE
jgi:hypothetical protein